MAELIWYETVNRYGSKTGVEEVVLVQNIKRLSRSSLSGRDITVIHLVNGDALRSADPIKVLAARIEGAGVGA